MCLFFEYEGAGAQEASVGYRQFREPKLGLKVAFASFRRRRVGAAASMKEI